MFPSGMSFGGGNIGSTGLGIQMGTPVQKPNLVQQQYQTAGAATQQNINDYMNLSDTYKSAISSLQNMPKYVPQQYQAPQSYTYTQDPRLTGAVGNLQNLSTTGGYDAQTIADMRARGVAPVRAAYANAMRQLNTAKNQEGGYSPNFAAAAAKMARQQGQGMADALTNVNAGIEQQVAQGKLAVAPELASVTKAISDATSQAANQTTAERNQVARANTDINNQATQFNLTYGPEQLSRLLQGATSLYGTTPALSRTFGDQALGNAQFQNQMNQQGFGNNMRLIGAYTSATH